jgi:hypothetical protein
MMMNISPQLCQHCLRSHNRACILGDSFST